MTNKATPRKLALVADDVGRMSDKDFVALVHQQVLQRPRLAPVRARVIGALKDAALDVVKSSSGLSVHEIRDRADVVAVNAPKHKTFASGPPETPIIEKARKAILAQEMLEVADLVSHLSTRTADDRARLRRKLGQMQRASALIALLDGERVLYPAFQVDTKKHRIHPEVEKVNVILGAANDPWGAASWWLSPHTRIGAAPHSLLGTAKSKQLIALAESLFDDSY